MLKQMAGNLEKANQNWTNIPQLTTIGNWQFCHYTPQSLNKKQNKTYVIELRHLFPFSH